MVDAPERIWLQNAEDAKHQCEGRLWCQDKVWPNEPEEGEPTRYIRADIAERELAEARAETNRLVEKGFDLITERDDARVENVRLTSHIEDTVEDKGRWEARAIAAEAERDRLAASRDGYAKAEKARADEQHRLAGELGRLKALLPDVLYILANNKAEGDKRAGELAEALRALTGGKDG